ncbi:hypothetical protein MTR67_014975 [Solanum verrucosum]|uniref:Uncharacterized protein n=1 Tax=Solanum verrucosum TaxID=315347 RepID=A0AAF0QG16_SOLVR|nr:hypothetical protein MTR67_014975 [Solanum verrucosum]
MVIPSLSSLLRNRFISVTIRDFLKDVSIFIIELSFPKDIQGIPPGVENAAKLPSMSYFRPFITATKLMQTLFEQGLSALQHPPTCVISDGFLGWTQESAEKIGIPRYFFSGGVFCCGVLESSTNSELIELYYVVGLLYAGGDKSRESVCAKVPILALPFMAEQHVNARMVTEEIGVGLRIIPRNGSVRGFVEVEEVEKMVRELMEGEMGEMMRKKVKELGENAEEAMKEGGSSWSTLGLLIDDACARKL